ncbi:MFS general substrate transporter [Pholiota conissans]|uniref:MFS general substrate transporter n=1 Tax=Pholiota conissans TaxID=109636 RepID=A0A9P6D5H3_9AGAR|nr:MFS general substrate transporter [Pholiota conissans]
MSPKVQTSESISQIDPAPSEQLEQDKESNVVVTEIDARSSAPPDGGLTAWLTVLGGFLVQFVAGYVNSFGVYQDFFVRDFLSNFSSSQISWIGSVATMLLMVTSVFSGRLFDRGHFHFLYITGSILLIVAIFTLSAAHPQSFYQACSFLLNLGIAYGLGAGMIYVPGIAIMAQHFSRKRALVMGIVASGGSFGAIVYPIMLNNLFHNSVGFANGVRASGGLIVGCLIIAALLMRTRASIRTVKHRSMLESARKFIKDDVYVLAVLGTFFYIQGLFFPIFYIQLLADEKGLNSVFSFYTLTILSSGSFVGRFVGGAAVNPFGAINSVTLSTFCCGVLIVSMLGLESIAGVTIFCILYGFFSGTYLTLLAPMWASMATDLSEIGLIGHSIALFFSMYNTHFDTSLGTPITGALLTRDQFIWWRPILYAAIASFIGTSFFFASRMRMAKRKRTNRC